MPTRADPFLPDGVRFRPLVATAAIGSHICQRIVAANDGLGRRVPPSASAFRRVLRVLDAQAVAAAFGSWLRGQVMAGLADAAALVVVLDGKTVRGARSGNSNAPHLGVYRHPYWVYLSKLGRAESRRTRPCLLGKLGPSDRITESLGSPDAYPKGLAFG